MDIFSHGFQYFLLFPSFCLSPTPRCCPCSLSFLIFLHPPLWLFFTSALDICICNYLCPSMSSLHASDSLMIPFILMASTAHLILYTDLPILTGSCTELTMKILASKPQHYLTVQTAFPPVVFALLFKLEI